MKKLLFLGLLGLSAQAFSQTCYVDLVVKNSNRVVRSFTGYGDPNTCIEGMKECRKAIRFDYSNNPQYPNGTLNCVRAVDNGPAPIPTPIPTPRPNPNYDYPTNIIVGETVFNVNNSRYAVVEGMDRQGRYVLRFNDNNATGGGWDRSDLAPLRGCDNRICVNDQIFNVNNSRYGKVVGLQTGGKFVIQFNDNNATGAGWDRSDLAPLSGCDQDICVNDQIFNVNNSRYGKVVGLQTGGKFVLQFNDNNATGAGWDRFDLAVMKGCQSGFCVGSKVYNENNHRYAHIQALQKGNKFVLRFDDNGATGGGWDVWDLVTVR